MRISFRSSKFEKECNEYRQLVRRQGDRRAKLIALRLGQLAAAANLEELRALPQVRCHELLHNRAGQISVDLDQPYRLIFESVTEPAPVKADGGLDWSSVVAIRILAVEDTHE